MLPLLLSGLASAQDAPAVPELNANLFHASVDSGVGFGVDDARVRPDRYVNTRVLLHYVNDPFVYQYEGGDRYELVSDLFAVQVLAGYTFGRLRVGADLPLYLVSAGQVQDGGVTLGDLGLDVKAVALDPASAPLGLAVAGRLLLPTGSNEIPVGDAGVGAELGAIASKDAGDWRLAANLGARLAPAVELENVDWGSQFFVRGGVGRAFSEKAGAALEMSANLGLSDFLANYASSPAEGMLSGYYRVHDNFVARLGVGTGITRGIGSPAARVIASVAFEPLEVRDTDEDGVVDKSDGCVDIPEDLDTFQDEDGCPDPDNDADGVADMADGCVNVAEDKDTWKDEDGCPDELTTVKVRVVDTKGNLVAGAKANLREHAGGSEFTVDVKPGTWTLAASAPDYVAGSIDNDVPNGPPVTLELVLKPEIKGGTLDLRVTGPEGKPIDAQWKVDKEEAQDAPGGVAQQKLLPGGHEVHVRAPGYASTSVKVNISLGQTTVLAVVLQPAKVVVSKEKLEILDKIYFDTGKTTIKKQSFPLLDEIARVLKDNPDILKVRIEGHTDSRGNDASNLKLSDGRAKAVMAYLVKAGIATDRMSASGFGESRPVDPAENDAAWEKNRRVEFVIEQRKE
ncbi:MAG: OmpA family protein [Myxococcota bacterium]